jgi:hypothetical protein
MCDGTISRRSKSKDAHPHESHEKLPEEIRGQHFDSYKEICHRLGCYRCRE